MLASLRDIESRFHPDCGTTGRYHWSALNQDNRPASRMVEGQFPAGQQTASSADGLKRSTRHLPEHRIERRFRPPPAEPTSDSSESKQRDPGTEKVVQEAERSYVHRRMADSDPQKLPMAFRSQMR